MIIYYKRSFYTAVLEKLTRERSLRYPQSTLNLLQHFVKLGIMVNCPTPETKYSVRLAEPFRLRNFLDRVASIVYSPNSIIF